ncbi:MAG: ferrochelatase [Micrococcales bacterium]|nr:ferrochelatase [Micrococcales bacterium]
MATTPLLAPYGAVLLASFGGPEGPDEVMPFLRRVTAGTGVPDARLAVVAEHYLARGGVSPINAANRALRDALAAELARRGVDVPVVWGNRNAPPWYAEALDEAEQVGASRVLALVTSAFASYSGCRQYREDFAEALVGRDLELDKVRVFFNHPGFVEANVDALVDACRALGEEGRVVFVTHSLPLSMLEASGACGPDYVAQHLEVARLVAHAAGERLGRRLEWDLAYCSRSGPPAQPWLEPDVNDHLAALAAQGVEAVVLAPIGFVSDHMEVVNDLDDEATATARAHGVRATRAATAGVHPAFVAGLVDLLLERAAAARASDAGVPGPEPVRVGDLPVRPDRCPPDGCRRQAGVDSGRPAACVAQPGETYQHDG